MITVGSLFSGIGAMELGLEWSGLGPVIFQVEIDEYCRSILERHWPAAMRFTDIKHVGKRNLPRVDVLCGGSPCPGFSRAGKQLGLDDHRSGMYSEYIRVVREIEPRYALFENVPQIRTLHDGAIFQKVIEDFASCGMDAVWWELSAADVGAPHLRKRLWCVAYRREQTMGDNDLQGLEGRRLQESERADGGPARKAGRQREERTAGSTIAALDKLLSRTSGRLDPGRWPAGKGEQQYDWEPPRVSIGEPRRPAQLQALGNIAVPQCAKVAGEVIVALEERRLKGLPPWTSQTSA